MLRTEPSRRAVLSTAGAVGLAAVAGCLEPDNNQNNRQTETGDDTPETTDAPEPDTLQGNPIIYHGETYQINNTEYTVPSSLDRGPQTVEVGGEEIDAYISNQEFHETAIANQFADSMSSIGDDHIYPKDTNVEGDTIELKVNTGTPREDMGGEIAAISGLYISALDEDEIPYNFELEIEDGAGDIYSASVDAELADEYISGDKNIQDVGLTIRNQM